MTAFIIIATVMVVGTLAWVVKPLWQNARVLMIALIFVGGIGTFALYRMLGTPSGINGFPETPQTLAEAVEQLRAALEQQPDLTKGWILLGQSYVRLGEYDKANQAYARAVELAPDVPDLLAEAAEVRAHSSADRLIDAQAAQWFRRVLELQPDNRRAAWYVGLWHRQNQQPAEAAAIWETLLSKLPKEAQPAILDEINQARAAANLPLLEQTVDTAEISTDDNAAAITITVELAQELQSSLSSEDLLFVSLRAPGDGHSMPWIAKRLPAKDFPVILELSDNDALTGAVQLSEIQQAVVSAHISKRGTAQRTSGDLVAKPQLIEIVNGHQYVVLIDQEVP